MTRSLPEALHRSIMTAAIAFLGLTLTGCVFFLLRPDAAAQFVARFALSAEERGLTDLSGGELFLALLVNNVNASFLSCLLGLLPFVRLPAFSLGLNAVLLGAFAAYYQTSGLGLLPFLAGTLPHGVFELPGLVIACGAGLYLCRSVSDHLLGRENAPPFLAAARDCARVLARLVFPLLLIAAAVEAFVTPAVLRLFV